MPFTKMNEKMSAQEIAETFGVDERTGRRWRAADDVRCYRNLSVPDISSGQTTPGDDSADVDTVEAIPDAQERFHELMTARAANFRQLYFLTHPEDGDYANLPANLKEIGECLMTTVAEAERKLEALVGT